MTSIPTERGGRKAKGDPSCLAHPPTFPVASSPVPTVKPFLALTQREALCKPEKEWHVYVLSLNTLWLDTNRKMMMMMMIRVMIIILMKVMMMISSHGVERQEHIS